MLFSLAAAIFEAIPMLTAPDDTGFAWTIYTGDLISHDQEISCPGESYYLKDWFVSYGAWA
jgi:hypothetical protein